VSVLKWEKNKKKSQNELMKQKLIKNMEISEKKSLPIQNE
jgi:hypothetical protein